MIYMYELSCMYSI